MYIGETSRNAYLRGQEHLRNYKNGDTKSPIYKHAVAHHQGRRDVEFRMVVKNSFRDPLTRQINEAVRISESNSEVQLNSKSEWHGPATVRLTVEGGA